VQSLEGSHVPEIRAAILHRLKDSFRTSRCGTGTIAFVERFHRELVKGEFVMIGSSLKKLAMAGIAAASIAATVVATSSPADAQRYGRGFRGGYGYHGGWGRGYGWGLGGLGAGLALGALAAPYAYGYGYPYYGYAGYPYRGPYVYPYGYRGAYYAY
jgi:hypothetical protein